MSTTQSEIAASVARWEGIQSGKLQPTADEAAQLSRQVRPTSTPQVTPAAPPVSAAPVPLTPHQAMAASVQRFEALAKDASSATDQERRIMAMGASAHQRTDAQPISRATDSMDLVNSMHKELHTLTVIDRPGVRHKVESLRQAAFEGKEITAEDVLALATLAGVELLEPEDAPAPEPEMVSADTFTVAEMRGYNLRSDAAKNLVFDKAAAMDMLTVAKAANISPDDLQLFLGALSQVDDVADLPAHDYRFVAALSEIAEANDELLRIAHAARLPLSTITAYLTELMK